ncbi:sodium ion-translocating decarboxylase subunit beta [Paeniclostridium sordellii]|uniref:sodium ion-translocating decarboxylase subunit beta n=1 Tax=Paraclostridium sordellii TaxID=1505 RepID=UPI002149E711|nr:sodium ion-translocating decarboxylase subunit beta [Paeniclostridium sordellii]MCR1849711.1 sodium ion-translocating decarboxylase subunit beta [Paeniclostridium sordellii]
MLQTFFANTGFAMVDYRQIIMILIACVFLYLAIAKGYEPYLLIPISIGMLLANMPGVDLMKPATDSENGGLLYYLYQGTKLGIYPPLIFLCIGASTDFGPIIANPKTLLLGAAAQFGVFFAFMGAIILSFTGPEAASIGIIGGADGPTAIYLTGKLAPHLLGTIALAAYSYMALVPVIQPPIIRALTTKEERMVKMEQLRPVSKTEKIVFPIVIMILVIGLLPSAAPLIGMLMFGNLIKESGVVPKLVETATGPLLYIITIILGLTVGATANAKTFLTPQTLGITAMGLVAFSVGTVAGVLFGKIMYKVTKGKVNPMIGAAGVSAVPMAARVVQKVGQEENSSNFLLMHAMGPNVAGVIGSAVAAGVLLQLFAK